MMQPRTLWKIAIILWVGLLVDWLWSHGWLWQNSPAFTYYLLKFFLVGGGILATVLLLSKSRVDQDFALLNGILVGVLFVQLYYGFYPIPDVGQLTLQQSIVGGSPVHAFDFFLGYGLVRWAYILFGKDWRDD